MKLRIRALLIISSDISWVRLRIDEVSFGRVRGERIRAVAIAMVLVLPKACSRDFVVKLGLSRIFTAFV